MKKLANFWIGFVSFGLGFIIGGLKLPKHNFTYSLVGGLIVCFGIFLFFINRKNK